MAKAQQVEVDGRELSLTNLDKVMYPATGFTKGEVIDYYARIAPTILPHLAGRALTLKRYPEGVDGGHFFEKRCPKHRPDWVETAAIWSEREDGEIAFCVCEDKPTLVWMAQLAALELHPSLSIAKRMKRPTVLAFDLDPGEPANVIDCARVALRVRELIGDAGLKCFPKTSGGKGLQVYVPLNGKLTYETTKPYAHAVAQALERMHPNEIVSRMTKRLRKGKVFVDWSQNTESKTTVAVYSLRARERPTVSTPLEWDEVEAAAESGDPEPIRFEAAAALERVEERGDLFAPVLDLEQKLPKLDALDPDSD
ncbi:MAG: non-homologous end-joining DNA ligase [Solirubrobacterales bacterium]